MYNKKVLSTAKKELNKAKAPKKPNDMIVDPMGQWKYPGLPTRIPSDNITMEGVGYPVLGVGNNGQRKIMLPGGNYTFPGADYVDEYPQMKRGGTRKRRKTKSLSGTNELMLPHPLLRNYKNRVYDPNVDYFQEGGISSLEGDLISKVIMERNKDKNFVQRAYALGENPGTSMFNAFEPDEFGQTMSHKMAWGEDDKGQAYMFPTVMNPKNEAVKVPNQYADYISNEGYKRATGMIPAEDYIEAELTDDEIEEYRKGGYIVEDISIPELNQAKDGGNIKTHKSKDGTITNTITKPNGDVVIQVKTKDGKYYEKVKKGLPQFVKDEFKKRADWENRSSGAAQPVDEFWTLPMGMTSAGVKSAAGLTKGLTSLGRNAIKSPLVQATKAAFNTAPSWLPGASLSNAIASYFAGAGANEYIDQNSDVRRAIKNAYDDPTAVNVTDAVGENLLNLLNFSGLNVRNQVNKGVKQLGKYAKIKTSLKEVPKQLPGSNNNVTFYHGGLEPNATLDDIDPFKLAARQQKKGRDYAGFYMSPDIEEGSFALKYHLNNPSSGLHKIELPSDSKAYEYSGSMERIKKSELEKLKEQGYDYIKGKNIFGQPEFVLLNKDKARLTEVSKQLGKYAIKGVNNANNKFGIKSQTLQNEYWPKSLTEHPDMEYVLQKTPVKDFKVRPVIENLPTKKTHGYDVTKDEVYQIINQNLEYLTDPEYIKRRQLTTKESPEKIQKEINKYIENLKKSKIDFNTLGDFAGVYKPGKRKILNPFKKTTPHVGLNPKEIKSRSHALHVLDHEIGHALSPISKGEFKGLSKYKNYPNLRIAKEHSEKGYLSSDHEQQVRLNRIKNYLYNKHGVSKNKPLSEEDFKLFTDDYNKWMSESHDGLGKGYIPIGMGDISDMLSGHIRTVGGGDKTRRNVRAAINKSWGLLPVGIGAGLLNNSQNQKLNQKKKGGIVAELTDDEIQDYINQGYIVEEIDEPKMQTGGQLPYQVWQEKTGTPWSEAKRQGLTDGSASANIALMNKLLAGETPTVEGSTPRVTPAQSNSGYEAYDRNVKQMVSNGASLEDLVNIRMGTREGLVNRFPDLFSASNAKSKEINKINIPQNKQTVATKVDTIVNKPDTAKINSVLPKLRHLPESTITRIPAPKVDTPIVKKFEKSKIKAQEKIKQKETEDLINNIRQQITPDTLLKEKRIPSGIIPLTPKPKTPNNFRPVITDTNMLPKIDTSLKTKSPKDIIKLQNTLKPGVKFEKGTKLTVEPEKENKIIKEDADYKVISSLTQRLNKFDESLQSYYYDYTNPHHTPEKRKQATQNFKAKIAERNNLINLINSKKRDYAGGLDSWIDESAPAWIKKPAQKMDLSDQVEATSYKLPALKTFKQKEEEDNEKFRTTKRVDDLGGNEKSSRWQFRVSASNDDPMKVQLYGTRGERNPNLNIKAKGAVMHFLDQSPLTGYMHPLTKDYYNNLKPDAFVGKLEKQKDGNYAVKYVPKKDIPAKELTKNTFLIRQEKFDNIDFSKKVADDNFSGHTYWTKKGTNKATIPVSSAKDANVYDYSSGQSVVFIFPYKGKTRYVHFAGSPNAIKKEGEEIKKQYKLQANKLVLGVADAGSYSSAVKGNITDKKLKDWNYGYANRNSFTGAGMALVD